MLVAKLLNARFDSNIPHRVSLDVEIERVDFLKLAKNLDRYVYITLLEDDGKEQSIPPEKIPPIK